MAGDINDSRALYSDLAARGITRSDIIDIISFLAAVPYETALKEPFNQSVEYSKVPEIFHDLDNHVPVAYITGRKEFYGYEFKVTRDTLIPRPDTETLIEAVLENINPNKPLEITDLYTGSGCILVTLLKKLPLAVGCGVDISAPALEVASFNARALGVNDRCKFVQADILADSFDNALLGTDVLTANPPYITTEEYEKSAPSLTFEPRTALEAGGGGYIHYKKLLCALINSGYNLGDRRNNLVQFYFEVGYDQAPTVQGYAHSLGLETVVFNDLAGRGRVVSGRLLR